MTAYIWDLDGTLIDSYPVIVEAARRTVCRAGLTDSGKEILAQVNGSTPITPKNSSAPWSGWPREKRTSSLLMPAAGKTLSMIRFWSV